MTRSGASTPMINLLTLYEGPSYRPDQFIVGIYNRLKKATPRGYELTLHTSVDDLCSQLQSAGNLLANVEIISHASPVMMGIVWCQQIPQLAQALQSAPPTARVYFNGCNSGCYVPDVNQFS